MVGDSWQPPPDGARRHAPAGPQSAAPATKKLPDFGGRESRDFPKGPCGCVWKLAAFKRSPHKKDQIREGSFKGALGLI